jgi:predicted amidohydrolase
MARCYRAAAVQSATFWATNPGDFHRRLDDWVEEAANRQWASLAVLPAYLGLALLGVAGPVHPEMDLDEVVTAAGYHTIGTCLHGVAPALKGAFESICRDVARFRNIYLLAGSIILPDDRGDLYNWAYLFGPDGRLMGRQAQTHLSEQDRAWGLSRASELQVFETDLGRLGVVLAEDVRYPEVCRILALQGAEVLLYPAIGGYLNHAKWLSRLWREVQANQTFGLEAPLVGGLWGGALRGRATIHAPLPITPQNDGILAQSEADGEDAVVVAELDFDARQRAIDNYPIFSVLNYDLYDRHFPGLYQGDGG